MWEWKLMVGWAPSWKRLTELPSCFHHGENTVKWQLCMNQQVGPHQAWHLSAPWFCIFSASRTVRNTCLLFISRPPTPQLIPFLLQLPEGTKSDSKPSVDRFFVSLTLFLFYFCLFSSLSSSFGVALSFSPPLPFSPSFLPILPSPSLPLLLLLIRYLFKENCNLKLCLCWLDEDWTREHIHFNPECLWSPCLSFLTLSLLLPSPPSFLLFFILGGYV